MITWRYNYQKVGDALSVDLVKNPGLLATDKALAAKAAVWFWKTRGLNAYADRGDFKNVCSIINTGQPGRTPNGWTERRHFYANALRVLPEGWTLGAAQPSALALNPAEDRPPDLHLPTPGHVVEPALLTATKRITAPMPQWDRGSGSYVNQHPTRYTWTPGVARLVDKYLNHSALKGRISLNTYVRHPPVFGSTYDLVSFDVWAWGGRGHSLTPELRKRVFEIIFNDPTPPAIAWVISGGGMWTPGYGWQGWNPPEDGSDAGHWKHSHWTMIRY